MSDTSLSSGTVSAPVTPATAVNATDKRSIQMRQFKSKAAVLACVNSNPQQTVAVGQIIGTVHDIIVKAGTLPNGESKDSLFMLGDFEATVYETGEVMSAFGAYMPAYFIEAAKARMGGKGGIDFAVEIVLEPLGLDEKTGLPKSIPFAYGVRQLLARPADHPLNAIKRALAAAGKLRLPAPPVFVASAERLQLADNADGAVIDGDGLPMGEGEADGMGDGGQAPGAAASAEDAASRAKAKTAAKK